jgi:MoaA/NifB/PqqE/SkfB family radical SAM enzyme
MAKAYSDLKVVHDLKRMGMLRSWRRTSSAKKPSPGQVQLILSDLCNHDCSFCAYRLSGYTSNQNFVKTKQMPTEKALEIISDLATLEVQGLQFTGGGEPTVHREHLRIMRHALELDLACGLVTNGNILRPGWEDILPRFRWVRVSLDAGNRDDYASIRRVKQSKWELVLANIEKMAKAGVPNLGTSFIVTKENYRGIYTAALAAERSGAAYFRVGAFYNPAMASYYDEAMLREAQDQIERACAGTRDGFLFDQFTKRLEYMARRPGDPFCGYQHLNVYVGGDQKVYRCCEYSYNDHGFLGDLKHRSFLEWWRDPETDLKYRCFDATKCVTCPFHTKNELIEFMTRDDISDTHPEFP